MFETLPVRQITCSMGAFMNGLTPNDRANLQKWVDSDWITNADLMRQIHDEAKVSLSKDTVSAHRRGQCRCSKV